jgi:predicted MFS family arabinose efflux permease
MASALVLLLASTQVMDCLARAGRSGLSAAHFAGVGAGIAISAGLVAMLQTGGAHWTDLWLASGGLALAGAVAAAFLLPPAAEPEPVAPIIAAQADPALRRMALAYGLFGFGYVITATFLVAIVRAEPAIRTMEPVIWVLVGLGAMPSVYLWQALARRLGTARAFAIAAVIEAASVTASVGGAGPVAVAVAGVLLGGTFMGLTVLGLRRGRELARGDPRPVMAALTSAFGIGQIAGPAVAGVISDQTGSFLAPSILAALALLLAAHLARR